MIDQHPCTDALVDSITRRSKLDYSSKLKRSLHARQIHKTSHHKCHQDISHNLCRHVACTQLLSRKSDQNCAFNYSTLRVSARSPSFHLYLSLLIMTLVTITPVLNSVIPSSTPSTVYTSKQLSASNINLASVTTGHSTNYKSNNNYDSINNNDNSGTNVLGTLTDATVHKSQVDDNLLKNVMSSDPTIYVTSDTCDWSGSGITTVDSLVQSPPRSIVPVHLRCNSGTIRWKYPRNGLRVILYSDSPFKGCLKVSSLLTESFVMSTLVHHRSYRQRRQLNPQTHSLYPVRISLESKNETTGANSLTKLYDPYDGKSIDLLRCFTSQGNSAALFVEALTPLNFHDIPSAATTSSLLKVTNVPQATINVNNNARQQLHASIIDDSPATTSSQYSTALHPFSVILPSIKETFTFDYHLIPLKSAESASPSEQSSFSSSTSSPVATSPVTLLKDQCEVCSDTQVLESFCTSDFVVSGFVSDIATVSSLERTELTVVVDKLYRDVTSDPSHRTSSSQLKLQTSNRKKLVTVLHDTSKCERKKLHGKYIFTGHWILGNPIVKCAASYKQFEKMKANALTNGSNLCLVK